MARLVSVVIVNWNGKPYLQGCLPSLLSQTYPYFEVILVDNGSTDGSVEFVSRTFPQIRLIENPENIGFAAGSNIGIEVAKGDYIATLNNDAQADRRWLEELVAPMEADHRVGMCASKILFADRPHTIESMGINLDKAGIAWHRFGGREESEVVDNEEPSEVFGPCAAAALYRRKMLDEIGYFDEEFFAYLEDVDLAWRARLMDWRCLLVPRAKVHHKHSATTKAGFPHKSYLLGRNKVWTILKNYPAPQILLFLPIILAYDLAAVLYVLLVRGDLNVLRGRVAGWLAVPRVLGKRKALQTRRSVSFATLAQSMSPLESPLKVWKRFRHLGKVDQKGE